LFFYRIFFIWFILISEHVDRDKIGLVGVCLVDDRTFETRVQQEGHYNRSCALIWNIPNATPLVFIKKKILLLFLYLFIYYFFFFRLLLKAHRRLRSFDSILFVLI
jgi:hypothetical protein